MHSEGRKIHSSTRKAVCQDIMDEPACVEVEVHHRQGIKPSEPIGLEEDKFDAVKVVRGGSVKDVDEVIHLFKKRAPAARRTMEITSFDNVFSPYLKPPT